MPSEQNDLNLCPRDIGGSSYPAIGHLVRNQDPLQKQRATIFSTLAEPPIPLSLSFIHSSVPTMAAPDNRDVPTIGEDCNGSKVVDVQVEVSDVGPRVRTRRRISLDSGAILIQDHWRDKKFEQLDTSRRRAPHRSRSGSVKQDRPPSSSLPQRGSLPKSRSGRHLPKPAGIPPTPTGSKRIPLRAESPARGTTRGRSSSCGRTTLLPHGGEARRSSSPRPSLRESPARSSSPANKRPSSLRNLKNFLNSPKRQPPTFTKSGSDLDALRSSLHETEAVETISPKKKPRSRRNLGRILPKSNGVGRSKSGDELEVMQQKQRTMTKRKSNATSESNKEKLKSFKEMISSTRTSKSSGTDQQRRASKPWANALPPTHTRPQRTLDMEQKNQESSGQQQREPSLSPEEVKKPSSSSYLTGFLDQLYDSYIKDEEDGGSDDDSDDGGYGHSSSLLDMSLNKFVEW